MTAILTYPDMFLREISREVKLPLTMDDELLITTMKETMYKKKGIGLAAIQIGYQKRIAVIDASASRDRPIVLINPVIVSQSDLTLTGDEGCLSVPGRTESVPRQTRIKVEYYCEHGKKLCKTFYDLTSVIIQHELDHMNGKLCIDYGQRNETTAEGN